MSLQVFLQAQLLGRHEFLAQPIPSSPSDSSFVFIGRYTWLNLYCEVLPRAILAELGLSLELRGSSSAEQFLLVLTEEDLMRANQLLWSANTALSELSGDTLRLAWASTEDLGPWPIVRRRLDQAFHAHVSTALGEYPESPGVFEPKTADDAGGKDAYFAQFAQGLTDAQTIGWSVEHPAELVWGGGSHSWAVVEQASEQPDAIVFARRAAQDDSGQPLDIPDLAVRADGAPRWGILLGDVDYFDAQLKRQGSIADHVHLSVLFKEFFAGELSVLCTLPEFWRKVTVLYRGGNNFAVAGSWDALLLLAREMQRLFARFVAGNLQTSPTPEGQTISMALAISPEKETSVPTVYREAAARLGETKTTAPDTFHLFGRTLEWKRLTDAEELKNSLVRLVAEHGYSPDYIHDLAAVYRESLATFGTPASRRKLPKVDKPWRTYMRLSRVIPQARRKEVNHLRTTVIASLIGKRTAALKLRPSGRVGLEWARLATGAAETSGDTQSARSLT